MKKLLTIVIPAYNSEQYLDKCLENMLDPICPEVEILIIDDGSKDATGTIADQYSLKHPEIVRVIHKENGGWGSGINLAIQKSKGLFFKIVDADDWILENSLSKLLSILRGASAEVDLVVTNYVEYALTENHKDFHKVIPHIPRKELDFRNIFEKYPGKWQVSVHSIAYRTEMLRKSGLVVNFRYYSDLEYKMIPLGSVRKILVDDLYVTNYCRHEGQSVSMTGYQRHYQDFLKVVQALAKSYNYQRNNKALRVLLKKEILSLIVFAYYLLLHPCCVEKNPKTISDLRDFDAQLKKNSKYLYWKSFFCLRKKIPFILFWRILRINVFKIAEVKNV